MDNDNQLADNKKDNKKPADPTKAAERTYGAGYKLIGKNYETPDLYAKVTGNAKYAEDFRACAGKAHRCESSACHARRQSDSHSR